MIPVDPRPRPIPKRDRAVEDGADDAQPTTPFGPYRASRNLSAIVAELDSPALTKRLCRHLSDFNFALNQLDHVPADRFRKWLIERFAAMYRQHLLDTEVAQANGRERDAWTHLVCVIAASARDRIRTLNAELHQTWLDSTKDRREAKRRLDRASARRASSATAGRPES